MSTEICKTSLVQAESMMWEFILKGNFNMKYQLFTDPETGVITLRVHTAQNAYEMDWYDTAKVV